MQELDAITKTLAKHNFKRPKKTSAASKNQPFSFGERKERFLGYAIKKMSVNPELRESVPQKCPCNKPFVPSKTESVVTRTAKMPVQQTLCTF